MIKRADREMFDTVLERVLADLPEELDEKLEEVPLIVEDYPSPRVMEQLGVHHRAMLCGLHTGIPLTHRSVLHSGTLPDQITIYREGILSVTAGRFGRVDKQELERQIRLTVLHEIGHHFGLGEGDLAELGYG